MPSPSNTALQPLTLPAETSSLDQVVSYVHSLCQLGQLTEKQAYTLRLAAEELVVNIINHGHPDTPGQLKVVGGVGPGEVWLQMIDSAGPFDPTAYDIDIDVNRPLHEREPGGLGIYLARSMVDEIAYEYKAGCNHTTISVNRP